jgi:hypothetical protein
MLEYLSPNDGNISDAARAFGINSPVVHDILGDLTTGDPKDRPREPVRYEV